MDWVYLACPRRRACNGSKARSAGVSRTLEHVVAGMGLARAGRVAGPGDLGDGVDQRLGTDVAQEKPAAAECRGDDAERIRPSRRRRSEQEACATEENVRFLFRSAGNGSRDSRR